MNLVIRMTCVVLLGSACLAQLPTAPQEVTGTKPNSAYVAQSSNAFAFDLYAKLAADKKGNLFFSPSSIDTALAMTHAGAAGNTADQMAKTLHFTLPPELLDSGFAELLGILNKPPQAEDLGDTSGKPLKRLAYELVVANALWGQKGFAFKPDFTQRLKKSYGAGLNEADFATSDEATKTINDWVADQTKDRIKDLIAKGLLSGNTRLVLTDAIYFKSNWATKFEKDATKDEPFKLSPDKSVDVPMMHQIEHFSYADNDDLQVVELPYNANALSMVIILPRKADGLAGVEKNLTNANIGKWLKELKRTEVDLTMPKFKFSSDFGLADTLKAMGMTDAFDANKADFSGMTDKEKLFISAVIHKAFVAVDEEGTEAAAATAVIMDSGGSFKPEEAKVFKADHPFIFMIRHNSTGAILFMGRMVNPKGDSQPTTQPVDAKEVARLIALLGDENYKVRDDATQKLVAMGEGATPLLKAKLQEKGLELEVTGRIETILRKTDKSVKEGTTVTDEATEITVSIEIGGVIARKAGKVIWKYVPPGSTNSSTASLRLENGHIIMAPHGTVLDLQTGKAIGGDPDKAEILKQLQITQ